MAGSLVYYAIGGGLGHLVRARAFLHTIGYAGRATVVTASEFATDPRVTQGLDVSLAPSALERDASAFRRWLGSELERVNADCLCVDTFPAGILGELPALQPIGLQLWHVARFVRWENYAPLLCNTPLQFDRCWRVEALHCDQQAFLDACCESSADLELCDPPRRTDMAAPNSRGYWLVVHSGPAAEVSELVAFANEIRAMECADVPLWVITRHTPAVLPASTRALDVFPATAYFAGAQRIFTAAGFNIMRQCVPYRHKQTLVPMPRRFDDQFERARRARHGAQTPRPTVQL